MRYTFLVLAMAAGLANAATPATSGAGSAAATPAMPAPPATPRDEAVAAAAMLGGKLKDELGAAMKAGGPLNALTRCHDQATPLTDLVGNETGWDAGRTSLRVRNPDNAPDSWERSVLEDFERRLAAGEPAAGLEHEATVKVGDSRYFRYMKAIPTAELCTVCHGTSINPELQAHIRTLYPDDRATGFKVGDLRGAFTLTRRLDP